MRIYDESGQEQDRAWLDTMFGPQVRVDASPDSPAFRLVEVWDSTEKAAVITVRDGNGDPMPGVAVVFAHTSGAHTVREKTGQDGQIAIRWIGAIATVSRPRQGPVTPASLASPPM